MNLDEFSYYFILGLINNKDNANDGEATAELVVVLILYSLQGVGRLLYCSTTAVWLLHEGQQHEDLGNNNTGNTEAHVTIAITVQIWININK